ncbi:MAG: pyridoxamine 5'-phosphate oxidase family protein [Bacteroidetes bacterium]|nr:pyridoxamine 5'-phosphate oxidase family protein [Bacteroidota bacterium]MDA1333232.1 pyridoxamine 5'-phosphate oxidase family protein [Bacteroidota bacterium]
MKGLLHFVGVAMVFLLLGCQETPSHPDTVKEESSPEWTSTHQVAWDIVASSGLVTLITNNAEGQPQARIVESLPPDSGHMDIWMGTNRNSAKVQEIQNDDRTTLLYRIPGGVGYVTLRGRASIVNDPVEKEERWLPHWEAFYPDRESMFVLIHFVPEDGEVVSFPAGLVGDSLTWAAPEFSF